MEKLTQILVVRSVAAQPGGTVLVHTEPESGSTWGGQPFLLREEEQPRVGQHLVMTVEERKS